MRREYALCVPGSAGFEPANVVPSSDSCAARTACPAGTPGPHHPCCPAGAASAQSTDIVPSPHPCTTGNPCPACAPVTPCTAGSTAAYLAGSELADSVSTPDSGPSSNSWTPGHTLVLPHHLNEVGAHEDAARAIYLTGPRSRHGGELS